MQLLPESVAKLLPPLYRQEEQGKNAIAVVKFFTRWTGWTIHRSFLCAGGSAASGRLVSRRRSAYLRPRLRWACCQTLHPPEPWRRRVPSEARPAKEGATGITPYLENGGTLEHAHQASAEGFGLQAAPPAEGSEPKAGPRPPKASGRRRIAAHESPRTTKLYDRTTDQVSLDEIERTAI